MAQVREHRLYAAHAVIGGVVVGHRHDVEAHPFQLVEQLRLGAHRRADGEIRVPFVRFTHDGFKVGESHVGAAHELHQIEVFGFDERAEPARQHHVAGQQHADPPLAGSIRHRTGPQSSMA